MSEQFDPYESPENFVKGLKVAARMLALGEMDRVEIKLGFIEVASEFEQHKHKYTNSYIRNTMNRVPEVMAVGSVAVSLGYDDDMRRCAVVTMRNGKMQVRSKRSDNEATNRARKDTLREVRKFTPDIISLGADAAPIAVAVVEMYRQFIDEMLEAGK